MIPPLNKHGNGIGHPTEKNESGNTVPKRSTGNKPSQVKGPIMLGCFCAKYWV